MTDRHNQHHRNIVDKSNVVPWSNSSGETVPAHAVVQLRTDYSSGLSYASKPNAADGLFFVNGQIEVPSGRRGESLLWDTPRRVRVLGSVKVGDAVGPVSGQWHMSTEGRGYYVIHQSVNGIATVVQGNSGGPQVSWGTLSQSSGRHDQLLMVKMRGSAAIQEFLPDLSNLSACPTPDGSGSGSGSGTECDGAFLDMDMDWCDAGSGASSGSGVSTIDVVALVPAGYKAGPVAMMKMPVCAAVPGPGSGSGSGQLHDDWQGWIVFFGRRMRAVTKIPAVVSCCPDGTLKITDWNRIWFFGGSCSPCVDPCPTTGSGSGGGGGGGGTGTGCFQAQTCCNGILWPNSCCGSDGSAQIGFC